ncbi:hypothetical protein GCM10008090_21990 [Arenicella chitinivorans]|uniref:TonB C-terminal domain-containing protein n=1 Tax=Arenicella chitinivorans TaxID=1329800 RepID=A0A918RT70_9GAMM|nr:hypothetical protein GCM10008090_21990 [Arenicella chitinivorans]
MVQLAYAKCRVNLLLLSFLSVCSADVLAQPPAQTAGWQIDVPQEQSNQSQQAPEQRAEAPVNESAPIAKSDDQITQEQMSVWEDTDEEEFKAIAESESEPQAKQEFPVRPILDLEPELRISLETIFARIVELQETEDAFSANLGEAYLTYGQALVRAGRLQEARKMLANALHITKINNGVNSIEQRPVLASMFELAIAQENLEVSQELVERILWLENNAMDRRDLDDFSFPFLVRLGNSYLDRYLYRPIKSATALHQLEQAQRFLTHAVKRYGDRPLNQLYMPYGELALVHLIKSKFKKDVERTWYPSNDRRANELLRRGVSDLPDFKPIGNAYGRAEQQLFSYLTKSLEENELEHTVKAFISLGDLNLLFNYRTTASQYYEKAWESAQALPAGHALLEKFQQPTALPDFFYAMQREDVEGKLATVLVPLTFALDKYGKVENFTDDTDASTSPKLISRAKRTARRMVFRPAIERGKMMPVEQVSYEVKVKVPRDEVNQG